MYTENSRIYLVSISIVGYCSNQFQMHYSYKLDRTFPLD